MNRKNFGRLSLNNSVRLYIKFHPSELLQRSIRIYRYVFTRSNGILIGRHSENGCMVQFEPPVGMKVSVDYTDKLLPLSIRTLKPVLYQDGDSVCCLLGPDPQAGVFGRGESPKEAMTDWDKHLKELITDPEGNKDIIQFIKETVQSSDIERYDLSNLRPGTHEPKA